MFPALGEVQVSATPYLLAMLAVFTASALLFAGAVLFDSKADHWLVMAGQRLRLAGTRMNRMLKSRQVDPGAYARTLTVAEIRSQIRTCKDCNCPELCDRALESHALRVPAPRARFTFCPNHLAIDRYVGVAAPKTR